MGMPQSLLPRGRRVLLAGFGGLLLLMMMAGAVDSIVRLHQVNVTAAKMRDAYFHRIQSLEEIRSGVYQSSIILRDYLLASDAGVGSRTGSEMGRTFVFKPTARSSESRLCGAGRSAPVSESAE